MKHATAPAFITSVVAMNSTVSIDLLMEDQAYLDELRRAVKTMSIDTAIDHMTQFINNNY